MGCLKKLTICATGGLSAKPDQLKKWIEANDGRWTQKMSRVVTHLVASETAWKTENEAVTTAKEMNIPIVSYDWLEDCLQSKRRLKEKKYLWSTLKNERKKNKQMKRVSMLADTIKFERGTEQASEDIGSGTSTSSCKSSLSPNVPAPARKSDGRVVTDDGNAFFQSSMAQLQVLRERREKQAAAKAAGLDLTMTETGEASKDTMGTTPGPNATGPFSETKDVTMHGTSNHPKSSPTGSGMGHKEVEGERISSQISFPSSSQSQTSTPPSFTPGAAPSLASIIAQTVSKPKRPPVAPPPEPEKPKTEKLTDHYHIFLDRSGFEYNISLIRTNLVRSCSAKYTIRLFESHTQPHTYCTYVRYAPMPKDAIPKTLANGIPIIEDFNKTKEKGKGKGKTIHPKMASAMAKMGQTPQPPEGEPTDRTNEPFSDLLAPTGSDYASAFTKFCTAFQELTFLTWEERLHSNVRKMQKSRARYLGLEPFVYAQPKIGLPKGVAPSIRLPPMKQEDLRKQTLQLPGMDVKINEEYSVGRVVVREEEQAKKIREEREEQIKESNRVNNKRKSKSSGSLRPDRRAKVVFTPTPSSNPNPNAPLFPASPRPRTTGTARGFGSNEAGMLIGMEMVNRDRNGMCHFRREED